jgi:nicotinamide mononucleotide (NMN) deamidase PncC
VGLFHIGLSHQGGTDSRKHIFQGEREQNKRQAAQTALAWVKDYLVSLSGC